MPESTQKTDPESPKAGPPPIPDPAAYDIALLRGLGVAYAKAPQHILLCQVVLGYGLLSFIFGLFKFFRHSAQIMLVPSVILVVFEWTILALTIAWALHRVVRAFTSKSKMAKHLLSFEPSESTRRIHILAKQVDVIAMLRSLPDIKSGFEPEIVRAPLAVGLDRAARSLAWLGGALGLVLAVVFEHTFYHTAIGLSMPLWFLVGMTSLGAVVLPEFSFPTYVRVVPGRLDVIRTPLFGNKFITIKSFDLRRRHIILAGGTIYIEPEETPIKVRSGRWPYTMVYSANFVPDAVSLLLTPARKRLMLAALWAATTEAPTPELPSDSLIG